MSVFFADDNALLLHSRYGLQQLLNILSAYSKQLCLDFNVKKSKVMVIGKSSSDIELALLLLNNQPLEYVSQYILISWRWRLCGQSNALFSNFYHMFIS